MGSYVPSTQSQRQEMLKALDINSYDELYCDVPESVKLKDLLDLPKGKSELEVVRDMTAIAEKNVLFRTILRGAGAYDHYIPAIVKSIPQKEEFLTAYTPYQAEMSQGILQSIFEYQTMIAELTGMDIANASVYDGASAAAEALAMCRDRKRSVSLISLSSHPDAVKTMETYCFASNNQLKTISCKGGRTDISILESLLTDDVSAVYVQQPNFFGIFEDIDAIAQCVHKAGAMLIVGCNPIALAIMKTPSQCGADIVVGEGQPLGMPIAFGGPYLGFMATTAKNMRKLPGRIVGQTVDHDGNTAYVLTLQAREQHIRREKASSNICSNQALCALTAAVYMSTMGADGMKQAAEQSMSKAHYLQRELCKLPNVELRYEQPYFDEFLLDMPKIDQILSSLERKGILGGLPFDDGVLWCVTEKVGKDMLDLVVATCKEVLQA
ncbi:MAG: aminomethyl-transferring glycine dehydrogenase subunit GcvPA [Eubacteriales bacterium]|nr:aminomethyl-transferring glycine dehydrogenase subunit GcvPA [Eubacteriales bacterium]